MKLISSGSPDAAGDVAFVVLLDLRRREELSDRLVLLEAEEVVEDRLHEVVDLVELHPAAGRLLAEVCSGLEDLGDLRLRHRLTVHGEAVVPGQELVGAVEVAEREVVRRSDLDFVLQPDVHGAVAEGLLEVGVLGRGRWAEVERRSDVVPLELGDLIGREAIRFPLGAGSEEAREDFQAGENRTRFLQLRDVDVPIEGDQRSLEVDDDGLLRVEGKPVVDGSERHQPTKRLLVADPDGDGRDVQLSVADEGVVVVTLELDVDPGDLVDFFAALGVDEIDLLADPHVAGRFRPVEFEGSDRKPVPLLAGLRDEVGSDELPVLISLPEDSLHSPASVDGAQGVHVDVEASRLRQDAEDLQHRRLVGVGESDLGGSREGRAIEEGLFDLGGHAGDLDVDQGAVGALQELFVPSRDESELRFVDPSFREHRSGVGVGDVEVGRAPRGEGRDELVDLADLAGLEAADQQVTLGADDLSALLPHEDLVRDRLVGRDGERRNEVSGQGIRRLVDGIVGLLYGGHFPTLPRTDVRDLVQEVVVAPVSQADGVDEHLLRRRGSFDQGLDRPLLDGRGPIVGVAVGEEDDSRDLPGLGEVEGSFEALGDAGQPSGRQLSDLLYMTGAGLHDVVHGGPDDVLDEVAGGRKRQDRGHEAGVPVFLQGEELLHQGPQGRHVAVHRTRGVEDEDEMGEGFLHLHVGGIDVFDENIEVLLGGPQEIVQGQGLHCIFSR